MNEVHEQPLAPVLRDLNGAGLAPARIEERGWTGLEDRPSAMVWSTDGSSFGGSVHRRPTPAERIVSAADQIQEWAIEELWGDAPTNWPQCPQHPDRGPMEATVQHKMAVWVCPVDERAAAMAGSLRRQEG